MYLGRRRRKDRIRRKLLSCSFCGKIGLKFVEERPGVWHLYEFDDDNKEVRHVCNIKQRWNNAVNKS